MFCTYYCSPSIKRVCSLIQKTPYLKNKIKYFSLWWLKNLNLFLRFWVYSFFSSQVLLFSQHVNCNFLFFNTSFPLSVDVWLLPWRPLTVTSPVSQPLLWIRGPVLVVVVARRVLLRQLLAVLWVSVRQRGGCGRDPAPRPRHPRVVLVLVPARGPVFVCPVGRGSGVRVVSGAGGVGGAAAAQGPEHGAGAGVQGQRGGLRFSDPGARGPVRFLDESHKHHTLIGSVLNLLLGRKEMKMRSKGENIVRNFWFNQNVSALIWATLTENQCCFDWNDKKYLD